MKVFSTFTGIGGFEIGIQHAMNTNRAFLNTDLVGYSEIDKYAISVFERQFKGVPNYGDITKIEAEALPDFDCLVGGFPCQAFSVAGKRKGFNDTRGTLFFDLARILRAKQPQLFVFENVKGLLNHDGGRTFRVIIATLTELGYDCQWQLLNSKNFGVPQNRERIVIVGHLRNTPRPEVFPIRGTNPKAISQINDPTHSRNRIYSPTLNTMQGGGRQPFIKVIEATKKGYAEATIGDSVNFEQPNSKTRRGRVGKQIANTLTTGVQQGVLISKTVRVGGRGSRHGSKQNWDSYEIDGVIRRLTPKECERLQAFPDDWTKYGRDNEIMSDTQRYKMCGNAVTTNVIQAVFEKIFASI